MFQPFQVLAVLRLGGQVVAVGDVVVRKRPAHRLHRQLIVDVAEQAAAHDLERFLGGHRLPQRLNAPEVMRKRSQRLFTTLAACLLDGLRQRGEQHRRRHRLQGLRQRLHETQVGIEGTTRQRLTFLKLPHIGHQLVDQDDAGRVAAQQIGQHIFARRGARSIGLRHQRVALGPTQLPCQITPQRADALPILDDRLVGRGLDAVQHGDARLGQICHACRIKDGGHALQVAGRCLALGEVIDRQHGVRLATAEGGLQLDHRVAAPARQALDHRIQQQPHAFSDEGALEEQRRVLVFRVGRACMHARQVGGEFGLLELAFPHIQVRFRDFAPGFNSHDLISPRHGVFPQRNWSLAHLRQKQEGHHLFRASLQLHHR